MKKKVTLDSIEKRGFTSYEEEVAYVHKQMQDGLLTPMKSSATNDRYPPLYLKYWMTTEEKQDYSDELNHLHYALDPTYYLSHQKEYEKVRSFVLALQQYLSRPHQRGKVSAREGAYEIFGYEKVFDENKHLLAHLGLSLEDLDFYETVEPIAYYTNGLFQNALIVENSSPYFTIRDLLLHHQTTFLGESFDTIIYGAGHRIESTLKEAKLSFLPYDLEKCRFYYCGDIDYEGLSIFDNARKLLPMKPFDAMYRLMLDHATNCQLTLMKEKQTQPSDDVYTCFAPDLHSRMQEVLKSGYYIPQEIINRRDLEDAS